MVGAMSQSLPPFASVFGSDDMCIRGTSFKEVGSNDITLVISHNICIAVIGSEEDLPVFFEYSIHNF